LFNVYIKEFPGTLKDTARTILFVDDTTIIVTSIDQNSLNDKLNIVMKRVSSWFRNNNLVLSLGKTHLIKFVTPKFQEYTLLVTYNNLRLKADDNVKFFRCVFRLST
jgi:protein associated with RNAse G/E